MLSDTLRLVQSDFLSSGERRSLANSLIDAPPEAAHPHAKLWAEIADASKERDDG